MDTNTPVVTPAWLDKDFFKNILQQDDSSNQINVLSFSAKPAVPAGNNYCCVVIRVNVEYERNGEPTKISLIIKTPPTAGVAKDMLDQMGVIEKECLIFQELLPIMNKMINKKIIPKNYVCQVPGTLILEDLNEQGYVMCDKLKQLDFDHCNTFMKVMGIFHALSVQVHNQDPELIQRVGKDIFYGLGSEGLEFLKVGFNSFASVVEQWEGYEQFSKFYKNNMNTIWNKTLEIHSGMKHIRVLNHGDAWTNNLLFKHDETGKVIDMKLIDLQACRFASPAIDLITFLLTSAQEDVKLHRLPELYATYLDSFNSTLKIIGCEERLTPEQLQDELKYADMIPYCLLIGYLPTVLSERDNVFDMNTAIEAYKNPDGNEMSPILQSLNGKTFKNVAKFTLRDLEHKEFFSSI